MTGPEPVHIPKDPVKRHRLARMAGLTEEEERALDEWCAQQAREQEAATRCGLEREGERPMP